MRPFLTLHRPLDARRHYGRGDWRDETLYALLARHAAERPDAPALRDGRTRLTFAQAKAWADGVAADLRARGLEGGDRVSIWSSNRVEGVILLLACSREGFACNPSLHRTHTCAEVAALLMRLAAKALFVEDGWGADRAHGDMDALLANLPDLRTVYAPQDFPGPGDAAGPAVSDPDKVTYLAFTSGTTGTPKCVMHSDNTLLANGRELVRDWDHGPSTVMYSISPLSHHIFWVGIAQWLAAGCLFVTDDPPNGMSRLDFIVETGATYVLGVPTHAMDIQAEQARRGLETLGRVRVFYMAGAPIPPSVAQAFLRQGVRPQNIYGMTENSSHQYTHPGDDETTVTSTCGRGGGAYEVRIFDAMDENRAVGVGETGQIGGRGAALMLGYFDNQDATAKSFNREGWFLSGDLGSMDDAGNLRIEGRLKDLIIRGGHNIHPAHIEALAIRHPLVERVACYPIPDERLGERVCIAVLGTVEPDSLLEHLAEGGLSKFDMPEYFIRLAVFPMTPSGKVLKRTLVEWTRGGEILPVPIRYRTISGKVA